MNRILSIALIAFAFGTCALAKHGGGEGHENGHGHGHGHGPGNGQGAMWMFGMDEESQKTFCTEANMVEDKIDLFREEIKKCDTDECLAEADDVTDKCEKDENKKMVKFVCSTKYKECRHKLMEKFQQLKGHQKKNGGEDESGGETDEGGDKDLKEEMKKKWKARKDCMKAAFDKAFGN